MKEEKRILDLSVLGIIISNSIPIFGVLFLGWSLFAIMFVYWIENISVGIYNLARMYKAESPGKKIKYSGPSGSGYTNSKWILIPFFILHYGMFMLVHGVFVFKLFGPPQVFSLSLALSALMLFLSHGVSHVVNFIGKGEYKKVSATELFIQPYNRMTALHVALILGGWGLMLLGTPMAGLFAMIVLKIIFDIIAHRKEHARFLSY